MICLKNNAFWAFVPLIAFVYYWFYVRAIHQIQDHGKYTVGYITGLRSGGKAMDGVAYYCTINKVRYASTGPVEPGMNTDSGSRYLVEFESLNPGENLIYTSYPLADNVPAPPSGG